MENNEQIAIFCDGSCKQKTTKKGGIGVYIPDQNIRISRAIDSPTTNQKCELLALDCAINITLLEENLTKKFCIYTDSSYSIGCTVKWNKNWERNGWKTSENKDVKNRDIIEPLVEKIKLANKDSTRVNIQFIKGHSTSIGNNEADNLAQNCCRD